MDNFQRFLKNKDGYTYIFAFYHNHAPEPTISRVVVIGTINAIGSDANVPGDNWARGSARSAAVPLIQVTASAW